MLRNAVMTASSAVMQVSGGARPVSIAVIQVMFPSNCNARVQGCHARVHGCTAHISFAVMHVSKSVMQACEYKFPLLCGKFQWRCHDQGL